MKRAVIAVIGVGVLLSGCATIVNGSKQSISVTSSPTTEAQCTLVNSEGTWYVKTPGSAMVHKTKHDLNITCTKPGFADATKKVSPSFSAMTFGNVIAGGIIGVGVDAASGANFEYPTVIDVPMTSTQAQSPTAATPPATTTSTNTSS